MSSLQHHTDTLDISMDNAYTQAFQRELGAKGFGSEGKVWGSLGGLACQDYTLVQGRRRGSSASAGEAGEGSEP
jgi:hypothetical protein